MTTTLTTEQRLERLERANRARLELAEHMDEHGHVHGSHGLIAPSPDPDLPARPRVDQAAVAAAERALAEATARLNGFWLEVTQPGRATRGFVPAHAAAGWVTGTEYERVAYTCPPERQGEHDRLREAVERALVHRNRVAGIVKPTEEVHIVVAPDGHQPLFRDGRWVAG